MGLQVMEYMGHNYINPTHNPLVTTHESPSTACMEGSRLHESPGSEVERPEERQTSAWKHVCMHGDEYIAEAPKLETQ